MAVEDHPLHLRISVHVRRGVPPPHLRGSLQLDRDQRVQDAQQSPREDEEDGRGHQESVVQFPLQGAGGRLGDVHVELVLLVDDTQLVSHADGGQGRQNPDGHDEFYGPGQPGHGVGLQGVADGQVSLDGESRDGEDGCVGGRLGHEPPEDAEDLAEEVRILVPKMVDVLGETEE